VQPTPAAPTGHLRPAGYLCQAVARSPDVAATWHLARVQATTADAALAWMRDQAGRLSAALLRPDGEDVWDRWLADRPYQQLQRQHLLAGEAISVNEARADRLHSRTVTVMYSLSCTPLTVTVPARVQAPTPASASSWLRRCLPWLRATC
jgi:hypothetical protein